MSNHDEVRIPVQQEIEEEDELVTPPPQQQADNAAAAGNASNEGKDENNDQTVYEDSIKTLYKAALQDDWKTAYERVFNGDPVKNSKYLTARITEEKDTALHIAVAAESFCFAEELVTYMEKDDLALQNSDGDTAFFLVAEYGMVGVAKVMFRKNNDLPGIRGRRVQKMLPIHIAALYGHEEMIEFLQGVTKDMTEQDTKKLNEYLGKDLFEERDSATENELHENMDEDTTEFPADNENIHKKLCKAASRNDWFTAYWEIFREDRKKISKYATASLTDKEDNALHIAAEVGSSIFIYFLRRYMSEKDLERLNADGNTAFYLAAKNGRFKCAELMLDKNEELLWIRGDANVLPIQIAAQQGRIKTVKFLYNAHDDATDLRRLSQEDCEKLLPNLICRADLIEVASKLLKKHSNIVNINIANGRRGKKTFLHALARTQMMSPELSNQIEEELIQPVFNKVSYKNKRPHEKLPKQALDLLKQLLDEINIRDDWMYEVINVAVEHENVGFLSFIICEYSELMICPVKENRKIASLIFSNAISKHWKDIFQLRESLCMSVQKQILDYKDEKGNNILHLAGKLSPPEQLDAISVFIVFKIDNIWLRILLSVSAYLPVSLFYYQCRWQLLDGLARFIPVK